jgi:hypothetical protein
VDKRVLLGSIVSVALAFPVAAFAQAAAESALTNALSSSSTIKAGSALNHALDQSSKRLGARIQERTSSPAQVGVQRTTSKAESKNTATVSQAGGNVHAGSTPVMGAISLQGGESVCAAANPSDQVPAKTNTGTASIDCHGPKSAPKSGTTEDKYKSFVVLSFPK